MNKNRFRVFEREAKKVEKNLQRKLRARKKEMTRLLKQLDELEKCKE